MHRWMIQPRELVAKLEQPGLVVLDCRFSLADTAAGERDYRAGHIPGAHYLHLDRDLSAPKARHGGRHPLPGPEAFTQAMNRVGVCSNPPSQVVIYDDQQLAFAARLWWLLRYMGHDGVELLAGGWRAWTEAGLPVSQDLPAEGRGVFSAAPRSHWLADVNEVKTAPQRDDMALVDAREPARYRGEMEPIDPIAGHIPGAVNRPWQDQVDSAGLRSSEALREQWGDLLQKEDLVVYCGSGVSACVDLLALAQLGREDARLYPGSWSDWCSWLEVAHGSQP